MRTFNACGRRTRKSSGERGLMLVETVFAIAIIGTLLATAAGAISVSARTLDFAGERTTASWIATSQAEFIRGTSFVATGGTYPNIGTPAGYSVTNSTTEFSGGNAAIQNVTVSVSRNGQVVLTRQIVKVNR